MERKIGVAVLAMAAMLGIWAPAARANIYPTAAGSAAAAAPTATAAAAAKAYSRASKKNPGAGETPAPAATSGSAPAGIGNYSYIEARYAETGSSDYLGDSAKGPGAKFSFQFGKHAYVYGRYDRLAFDRSPGYLYRTGVGIGYQETRGRISAFLQIAYFREAVSGDHGQAKGGARGYYFEPAYGMRAAFGRHFAIEGELYSDFHPEFGSRPLGIKIGVAGAFGPVSLHLAADHNRDVNRLTAALRYSF